MIHRYPYLSLLFLLPALACASRQPAPNYVRAEPVKEEPPRPVVVEIPRPVAVPGQLKRSAVPISVAIRHTPPPPHARRASDVIRDANRKATEGPTDADYFNAIMTYDFAPGALYQIYTAPQHLTDVQLQPGEHLVGKPATGDTIRWVLARGASAAGNSEQQHIYIKPTRPDLETTLALNTDRRSYILELHSYDDTYMAGVAWRYPQDEAAQLETNLEQQQTLIANATPKARSAMQQRSAVRVGM
jgi:type IV secretion system protein TrbG